MLTHPIHPEIIAFNDAIHDNEHRIICHTLSKVITENLISADHKIWHGHPVWFIDENPIVGYSHQKAGIRLMFWSGSDFDEGQLNIRGKKFKDASIFFNHPEEMDNDIIIRWLEKSKIIQWDYKNLIKRKGKLERLK